MNTPPPADVQEQYREVLERFYASPMWLALLDAEREAECLRCRP